MTTILVTGATDGLGRGIVRALAGPGLTLLVHGRDPARLAATSDELRTAGATVHGYLADLASLVEVRGFAAAVLANEPRLDVLINNAGIGSSVPTRDRAESRDGIELRFAVNYLSHYLLTRELVPLLERSAPARIVNVSSIGQAAIDFADPMITHDYSGGRAYRQSKLAQVLSTIDLADQLRGTGVTVTALHPATYMPTKIVAAPISSLADGVAATLHLAIDAATAGLTGVFFDGMREARADPQAYDPAARAQLRALSERLVSGPSAPERSPPVVG